MKIFLTGGTGVLGRRVVKLLSENNAEVVVLSRSAENAALITQLGGTPFSGDLFNPDDLIRGTAGADAILHLATHIPRASKTSAWALNDRIRTEGTSNLLRAARTNGVPFFLQQSVALLYGDQQGREVTPETQLPAKQPAMLRSAVEMERLIREASGKGLAYAILRFGNFYSADSVQTRGLLENFRKGKVPLIGKGDFFWNMIHADDAAAAVAFVLFNRARFENKILNISDFNPLRFNELLTELAMATHSDIPRRVPRYLARLVLGKDTFKVMTASYRITDAQAMEGWTPRYRGFREGLRSLGI